MVCAECSDDMCGLARENWHVKCPQCREPEFVMTRNGKKTLRKVYFP